MHLSIHQLWLQYNWCLVFRLVKGNVSFSAVYIRYTLHLDKSTSMRLNHTNILVSSTGNSRSISIPLPCAVPMCFLWSPTDSTIFCRLLTLRQKIQPNLCLGEWCRIVHHIQLGTNKHFLPGERWIDITLLFIWIIIFVIYCVDDIYSFLCNFSLLFIILITSLICFGSWLLLNVCNNL